MQFKTKAEDGERERGENQNVI